MGHKRHWIRRVLLGLLCLYAAAALVPYIFVPAPPQAVTASAELAQTSDPAQRAAIVPTGENALDARLQLISTAQTSLVVGTYLYADDESGKNIAAALLDAADRGVQVRILTDGLIGGANLLNSDLGYALGSHPNIDFRFYNPLNVLAPWSLNACYHEKYVIADSRLFVLGGRNISDEFLTPEDHPKYNYDLDVLVYSPEPAPNTAAAALLDYFDGLWESDLCSRQFTQVPSGRHASVAELQAQLKQRYAALQAERPQAFVPADWQALTVPIQGFSLLHNPVEATAKAPVLWQELTGLMQTAQERVWIQTPYLVLNGPMKDGLNAAAEGSAEMRILTNSKAGGNNIAASADMLIHKGMVTRMSLTLYELQTDHSMHTKAMLVDDHLSVFGSFNYDIRSAYIDTEVMLAVESPELNQQLERYMLGLYGQALPVEADGSYGESDTVQPKTIEWGKNLMITIASPFLSLFRFLV